MFGLSKCNGLSIRRLGRCGQQKCWNTTFVRPELRRIKGRLGSERWIPEGEFDLLVYWDRKFRRVMRMRSIIESQEESVLSLWELNKNIKINVKCKDRKEFKDKVLKYPGVFRVFRDKDQETWVEFTEAAERLIQEELKIKLEEGEGHAVEMIRKLLMMAQNRRIDIAKLNLCRRDFVLPDCSTLHLVKRYPQYFKIVDESGFPAIELKDWDPTLAVTAREKWVMQTPTAGKYEFPMSQPRRFKPSDRMLLAIQEFQELPFPSPYEDSGDMDPSCPEAQKRIVAVCHEYLSMTLEKMTMINQFACFTPEFQLQKKMELFFKKYPGIFYVSHKGDQEQHIVFLKEAYDGPFLLGKHPLVVIKDRFLELLQVKPDRIINDEPEKLINWNKMDEEASEVRDEEQYSGEEEEYNDFSLERFLEQRDVMDEFIKEI